MPVYNGASNLASLVPRLRDLCARLDGADRLEVIFVNDGSGDASWSVIEEAARSMAWARGIDLAFNAGQHAALLCGALHAANDVVVTLDDDLQHPPEAVPKLVAALRPGVDLVYGTPRDRGPLGIRRAGSFAARVALALRARSSSGLHSSAFRAFRTVLRSSFPELGAGPINLDALLYRAGASAARLDVDHAVQAEGGSRYTLPRLARAASAVAFGPRRSGDQDLFTIRARTDAQPLTSPGGRRD